MMVAWKTGAGNGIGRLALRVLTAHGHHARAGIRDLDGRDVEQPADGSATLPHRRRPSDRGDARATAVIESQVRRPFHGKEREPLLPIT